MVYYFLFIQIRQAGFSYHLLSYRPFTVSLVYMKATWIKLFDRKPGPAAMWPPLLHNYASKKRMSNIRVLPAMFSSVRNSSVHWTLNYSSDGEFMKYEYIVWLLGNFNINSCNRNCSVRHKRHSLSQSPLFVLMNSINTKDHLQWRRLLQVSLFFQTLSSFQNRT
jgi:hypothetical protein